MDVLVAIHLMTSTSCPDCSSATGEFFRSRILQLRCKYGSQPANWNTLEDPRLCSFKEWTYSNPLRIRSRRTCSLRQCTRKRLSTLFTLYYGKWMCSFSLHASWMALESRVLCPAAWIYAVLPCIGFIVPVVLENLFLASGSPYLVSLSLFGQDPLRVEWIR